MKTVFKFKETGKKYYRKINPVIIKLSIFFMGLAALLWFLIRVIPKPSRASYPCQRAAFPIASAFVLWLAGTLFSHTIFRKAKVAFKRRKNVKALVYSLFAISIFFISAFALQIKDSVYGAINYVTVLKEGKMLYAGEMAAINESIITPKSTVAIIKSDKSNAADITFEDIDSMIHQAVEMAGGFDTLIHEGDLVVIKPNVIAARAQNDSYSNAFPEEANGVATDYRVIQVVVNMVREKNSTGKIILIEGSGYGLTRNNINAIGYDKITGLDSIICLDENIETWYDPNSPTLVKVSLPTGKSLYGSGNNYYLNKVYYEADVLISLPCLKSHFLTGITGGVKNVGIGATPVEMYGNGLSVPEDDLAGRWNHIDHGDFSSVTLPLDKWIHDFYMCRPVNYVIMDGLQGVEYGPYPGSNTSHSLSSVQKNMRVILAGSDPLAVDAIEALVAGFDPYLIRYLVYLGNDSVGCINSAFIKVKGTQVHEIKTDFREDNPGRQWKTDDFTPPYHDTLTSCSVDDNNIYISLVTGEDVVKVEVAYNDTILDPIVVDDFSNIVFPYTNAGGDANKVSVLLYDKYLNCSELSLAHPTAMSEHFQVKPLKIYPNPSTSVIYFNMPENKAGKEDISLYTTDGRLILYKKLNGREKQQLNISNFQPGMYILKLAADDILYQATLVKSDE